MREPGLDLHEWETRWQDLQDAAADAPDETLSEIVLLIQEMLTERGYDVENPVVAENEDFDVVKAFLSAREAARLVDQGGAEPEDVENGLQDLRDIYDYLATDRAAP